MIATYVWYVHLEWLLHMYVCRYTDKQLFKVKNIFDKIILKCFSNLAQGVALNLPDRKFLQVTQHKISFLFYLVLSIDLLSAQM
jgi:hypothetical protein